MHLHLNPLGGLAGDMFCAALLHARPDLLPQVQDALTGLDMPVPAAVESIPVEGLIDGRRFRVTATKPTHDRHHHTAFRDIRNLLRNSSLAIGARNRAIAIFTLLAEAEAQVHGVETDVVSFHEVGSWDSIADIVSASVLIEALGVSSASTGPLPLGGGRVKTAHGWLPVPAPATSILLQGLPVIDDGIGGERVTPTGAAILRALRPETGSNAGGVVRHSGMGFGNRDLGDIPNCLQITCLERDSWLGRDQVAVLRFDIDDQNPEDFALALDRLRSEDGVLSVTSTQAIGKQGRPTMRVELLARPQQKRAVADACFRETTTIGLRWEETQRLLLPREQHQLRLDGETVEIKRVQRPGGTSVKLEARDLASAASQSERERMRRAAATRAEQSGEYD